MKRLITASILFFFVLIFCLSESIFINSFLNETKNTVQYLEEEYLNGADLSIRLIDFNEHWIKNKFVFSLFINKKLLLEISNKIALLNTVYHNNKDEFLSLTTEIVLILDDIQNNERINLFGVL